MVACGVVTGGTVAGGVVSWKMEDVNGSCKL